MARDLSSFTRRITVNYPAFAIYEAWTIPSQIERWFLRSADYVGFDGKPKSRDLSVEAGDGYLWRWHGYLDEVNESGTVVEANNQDKIRVFIHRQLSRYGHDQGGEKRDRCRAYAEPDPG